MNVEKKFNENYNTKISHPDDRNAWKKEFNPEKHPQNCSIDPMTNDWKNDWKKGKI